MNTRMLTAWSGGMEVGPTQGYGKKRTPAGLASSWHQLGAGMEAH